MPLLALGGIGRGNDSLFQNIILPAALAHPLQECGKLFLGLFLSGLQPFQRIDGALLPAQAGEKLIQFAAHSGCKFRGRLVGWELPAFTDAFQRRIVLALQHILQNGAIEFPGRCRQLPVLNAVW